MPSGLDSPIDSRLVTRICLSAAVVSRYYLVSQQTITAPCHLPKEDANYALVRITSCGIFIPLELRRR